MTRYLDTDGVPIPIPDRDTQPYWDGTARHQLLVQHCQRCGQWIWQPRPLCPSCHAEHPHSRTRRLIGNVRIAAEAGDTIEATANFIIHRFRRGDDTRIFVGQYRYKLRRVAGALKISERRVILDAEELGMLGAVSFIL